MAIIYWRGTKKGGAYYSGLRIQGKLIRKRLSRDKSIAQTMLEELKKSGEAQKTGHNTKDILWDDFKKEYLEHCRSCMNGGTPDRMERSIVSLERFEKPTHAYKITLRLLERFITYRLSKGIQATTITTEIKLLKMMLKKAMEWHYLDNMNLGLVKTPRITTKKLLFWSKEESQKLLKVCSTIESGEEWKTVFMLAIGAGLRKGEIFNLETSDLDFENHRILITSKTAWTPKTNKQRHIPMAPYLLNHFAGLKLNGGKVVRLNISIKKAEKILRKIIKKADLKGTLHTGRHTFASHLVQAGVPLYTVSKLLGHSNLKTTEIYAHLAPETYQSAIACLPALV